MVDKVAVISSNQVCQNVTTLNKISKEFSMKFVSASLKKSFLNASCFCVLMFMSLVSVGFGAEYVQIKNYDVTVNERELERKVELFNGQVTGIELRLQRMDRSAMAVAFVKFQSRDDANDFRRSTRYRSLIVSEYDEVMTCCGTYRGQATCGGFSGYSCNVKVINKNVSNRGVELFW